VTSIADLEIFARVVTAGSMSAAGRELDLSPAVVSKRISHLETRLGSRLFHRTTRQLQLTETGRGFYERVVHILANVQEAVAYVSSGHERAVGLLRITTPVAFGRLHIAPYLGMFLKQNPEVSVEIIATDHLLDIMRDKIDLAIRIFEPDDSGFFIQKLAPCRRFFCASKEYLSENGTPKTLAELSDHKVIVENNAPLRVQGPEGVVSLKLMSAIKTNSSEVVQQAVVHGCGIGFQSSWQAREETLQKKLIPILPLHREPTALAIYALSPDKQYVPAKARVFLDFLAKLYDENHPYWDKGLDLSPQRGTQKKPGSQAANATA
jgi:DNA-binding transcriptional LysR family regulator